jgi:hypothetical protein
MRRHRRSAAKGGPLSEVIRDASNPDRARRIVTGKDRAGRRPTKPSFRRAPTRAAAGAAKQQPRSRHTCGSPASRSRTQAVAKAVPVPHARVSTNAGLHPHVATHLRAIEMRGKRSLEAGTGRLWPSSNCPFLRHLRRPTRALATCGVASAAGCRLTAAVSPWHESCSETAPDGRGCRANL